MTVDSKPCILAIDQGTTSSRAIAFDEQANIVGVAQQEFTQLYPHQGWVEHDPELIWQTAISVARQVFNTAENKGYKVASIGITNQRETSIVWDRASGTPIYNAIVWQDRRTSTFCESIKTDNIEKELNETTGLLIDPYFSASKIAWILDNVTGARRRAELGELAFGTVDSFLINRLTGGQVHVTDATNACRTSLYNIHTGTWDDNMLGLFNVPSAILPKVLNSIDDFGMTSPSLFGRSIPITGVAGDQQAALFGQLCTQKGMVKNTYGTGCFLLMNTGEKPVLSNNKLLTTVAWQINGKTHYALEGSVFVGGAAVQWLRDGINIIDDARDIEDLAKQVKDSDGLVVVPAFTGLGAPHWDPYARGSILGITRGTTRAHIARATLEGIALQVYDIVKAMESDADVELTELRVDGGASANNLLLQIQSNIFDCDVIRPTNLETTALGAAYLAGLAVGFYKGIENLQSQWEKEKTFTSNIENNKRDSLINQWHKATERSKNWEV